MSLDLYLHGELRPTADSSGIFIRVGGEQFEITRAEWDRRNPGREPVFAQQNKETTVVWHRNITHNLAPMAVAAGLYKPLWRPDDIGATHAHMLIERVKAGLQNLVENKDLMLQFEPDNGWGTYDQLIDFTRSFLAACEESPECIVHACT